MIKEIFEYLKSEGLQPEMKEYGIFFRYQMMSFYILNYEDDDHFLRVVLPGIMDVDANNRVDVLEACNKVTAEMKIVKAYVMDSSDGDNVWLSTEQILDADPQLVDIIPRSLNVLLSAYREFGEAINS